MQTPIVDFVRRYVAEDRTRFHMPGHKGRKLLGCEPFDITEIEGADVLHHGEGILRESERNASALFGSGATHYSAEGSTLCIKAMLAILKMERGSAADTERQWLLAARNVHRSMVDACALLDLDVRFLWEKGSESICSSVVSPDALERTLQGSQTLPLGIYVTSPDYLGQVTDIAALAEIAHRWELPLLVDNAHGSYLHFLKERRHPLDLGAAMCSDSAHKTLPALTGAAYLHIHRDYLERFEPYVKQAMTIFSSTSPSYLLLQSLDWCNACLAGDYPQRLEALAGRLEEWRETARLRGVCVRESEPLKLVLNTAECGYDGREIAQELRKYLIECEYADWQNVVLMVTPENTERDFERLTEWMEQSRLIHQKKKALPPEEVFTKCPEQVMSIREAAFARNELVLPEEAVGRICASQVIACPPAVPIAVCGERISREMADAFLRYGIPKVCVVVRE